MIEILGAALVILVPAGIIVWGLDRVLPSAESRRRDLDRLWTTVRDAWDAGDLERAERVAARAVRLARRWFGDDPPEATWAWFDLLSLRCSKESDDDDPSGLERRTDYGSMRSAFESLPHNDPSRAGWLALEAERLTAVGQTELAVAQFDALQALDRAWYGDDGPHESTVDELRALAQAG